MKTVAFILTTVRTSNPKICQAVSPRVVVRRKDNFGARAEFDRVKPAYNGTLRDLKFISRFGLVAFITGT